MRKQLFKSASIVLAAVMVLLPAGCSKTGSGTDETGSESEAFVFEPDLADTEWIAYRIGKDGKYIATAEYSFTKDRMKHLDLDNEYTLHLGDEAYTEALITEETAEGMYSEDSFDGDERGGFLTIISHYEDGGKDGLYGWMNKAMDKMEMTDPYDGASLYFFLKGSGAEAVYEKKVTPYIAAFMKDNYKEADGYDPSYSDRTLLLTSQLEDADGASEEIVKNDEFIDAIGATFDDYEAEGARLADALDSMLFLEGNRVRLEYTFNDELIGCAVYDKSGEIEEERVLFGR